MIHQIYITYFFCNLRVISNKPFMQIHQSICRIHSQCPVRGPWSGCAGKGASQHLPKSSKRSTFSHKMGKKWDFVGGLRGWGPKGSLLGGFCTSKIYPGYWPVLYSSFRHCWVERFVSLNLKMKHNCIILHFVLDLSKRTIDMYSGNLSRWTFMNISTPEPLTCLFWWRYCCTDFGHSRFQLCFLCSQHLQMITYCHK